MYGASAWNKMIYCKKHFRYLPTMQSAGSLQNVPYNCSMRQTDELLSHWLLELCHHSK